MSPRLFHPEISPEDEQRKRQANLFPLRTSVSNLSSHTKYCTETKTKVPSASSGKHPVGMAARMLRHNGTASSKLATGMPPEQGLVQKQCKQPSRHRHTKGSLEQRQLLLLSKSATNATLRRRFGAPPLSHHYTATIVHYFQNKKKVPAGSASPLQAHQEVSFVQRRRVRSLT